ncbi:MAG: flagellar biosis protein [Bacillales bacterium]|jgi:flagellar protein FliO/FliZ|nr:flagellar biosis protein [Bacillales bacterium]
MKRFISLSILFFYIISFQSPIYAAGSTKNQSVYDKLQKNEKTTTKSEKKDTSSQSTSESQSPSLFFLLIKFVFYFLLVIGLLYMVLQFLSKRNRLLPSNGPILSLGGQPLGNNKSMQILLVGKTIYIVGVGDSVSLMRTISEGDEYEHLLEHLENQGKIEGLSQNWFPIDTKKIWNSIFRQDLQNNQYGLGNYENQSQREKFPQKWFPINTKKIWNSIFQKDLQNIQDELGSLKNQNQGEEQTQKWIPMDQKKMWDSVFQKHMQKIQQESEEER